MEMIYGYERKDNAFFSHLKTLGGFTVHLDDEDINFIMETLELEKFSVQYYQVVRIMVGRFMIEAIALRDHPSVTFTALPDVDMVYMIHESQRGGTLQEVEYERAELEALEVFSVGVTNDFPKLNLGAGKMLNNLGGGLISLLSKFADWKDGIKSERYEPEQKMVGYTPTEMLEMTDEEYEDVRLEQGIIEYEDDEEENILEYDDVIEAEWELVDDVPQLEYEENL